MVVVSPQLSVILLLSRKAQNLRYDVAQIPAQDEYRPDKFLGFQVDIIRKSYSGRQSWRASIVNHRMSQGIRWELRIERQYATSDETALRHQQQSRLSIFILIV